MSSTSRRVRAASFEVALAERPPVARLDPQDDQASDQERGRHRNRVKELCLDEGAEREAEHHAGRNATITLSAKRCAARSRAMPATVSISFCRVLPDHRQHRAVWIAISKVATFSPRNPSSELARIRWPVDEIAGIQ